MNSPLSANQNPQSVWLLMLDEESLVELELDVEFGAEEYNCWTCFPYIEPGDLLFFIT